MDSIRVRMTPHPDEVRGREHSGIAQVVVNWARWLPEFGVDVVAMNDERFDLSIGHSAADVGADIHVSHGLLWTEEFKDLGQYAYDVNADLVKAALYARTIIVPSQWVADVYRRDMRRDVHVIGHGVNTEEWEHDFPFGEYVLYTKNRTKDGLDPSQINEVALAFPHHKFYTTFATRDSPPNVITYGGTVPHSEMKRHIQEAGIVFMPDRETWGITAAEAMASGVPVVSTNAGAVKEFVTHGDTGYIYQHRNLADVIQAIGWTLKHGRVLGDNGKKWARINLEWRDSVSRIANVIRHTYEDMAEERRLYQVGSFNTVDAVITSHNYGHKVDRAIRSLLEQSWEINRIIVVDDSSDEGDTTKEVVEEQHAHSLIEYHRVEYGNVAEARNYGIYESEAMFVLVLDGDDWIKTGFVRDCVQPMLKDRAVDFVYSGTEVILDETGEHLLPPELAEAEGKRGHKPWPTMDVDKQFMPGSANQFPATALFRRSALLRVGGYRARYAPRGAGTEDANLYLRLLTHGSRPFMVKPKMDNLWVHTHGEGHVSGSKDYKEVNWRNWRPETTDFRFPLAAAATPKNKAHPVRSYEPKVSVIIPVGPGHAHKLANALDSLEAQVYRNWEAVVVWDYDPGIEFSQYYQIAYPYVRWTSSFKPNPGGAGMIGQGPGVARNYGVMNSNSAYITFLDADDYYSPEFLSHVNPETSLKYNAVLYSQYYSRMSHDIHTKIGGNVVKDEGDTVVVSENFRRYNAATALLRPTMPKPYVWTGINVLLPREWHEDMGGFDESLSSWEDCLYMLELAWRGHDFRQIRHPLWVYNWDDGSRRENSAGHEESLIEYFQRKYDSIAGVRDAV